MVRGKVRPWAGEGVQFKYAASNEQDKQTFFSVWLHRVLGNIPYHYKDCRRLSRNKTKEIGNGQSLIYFQNFKIV